MLEGRLEAFGFAPTRTTIEAIARDGSWRWTRALLAVGIAIGVTPVVVFVPPHFPWVIGALGAGVALAHRRLTERYTLRSMNASCPRCRAAVTAEPGRLTPERTVHCPSCGQQLVLRVDLP
jgi:hypothetical protein